jgi:hypothetical protein
MGLVSQSGARAIPYCRIVAARRSLNDATPRANSIGREDW